jgi:hypothetical protein
MKRWHDLCVEGLVTADVAVSVPLGVDSLVGGNVDNLGLSLHLVLDLLRLRSRGDLGGSNLEFGLVALLRRGLSSGGGGGGSRAGLLGGGRSSRGLGGSAILLITGSLTTAHVEVHVLLEIAGLGLDVIGKDVGHLVASSSIAAGHDGAPGVGGRGLDGASLRTNLQVVTLLPGWAVTVVGRAVDVRDIKVVVVEAGRVLLEEVLELGDVVTLALLALGQLDRDTDVAALGVLVVLLVDIALLQGDHLAGRAAITLVDGPQVDIVGATVVDTGQRLAGIALLVEGDCAPGGGSGSHGGRDGKDSNELHFGIRPDSS